MTITEATDQAQWDSFLNGQPFRPFLQSWTMGEVYRDIGEEPIRLEAREDGKIVGICQAVLVPARRGKHLTVPYGPIVNYQLSIVHSVLDALTEKLKLIAKEKKCTFIRMSPFWQDTAENQSLLAGTKASPLHLLAEHLWYLPLVDPDPWAMPNSAVTHPRSEDDIFKAMRSTARNLVRRAQKEGVTIRASTDPNREIDHFLALHDETRKRHGFTPYTNAFFRAQVKRFSERNECTLYLADYQGEVIAASIHMHCGGETSYHHGASSQKYRNIPASYLLQWTAITDALRRGDRIYNFWGIAPEGVKHHPFAGVTLFKTGFGGQLLPLVHCADIPLSPAYFLTRGFEFVRKWRRGF